MDIESKLTLREFEVFKLVVAGSTNQQIAGILGMSKRTVEFHRRNVHIKLDVPNIALLVRLAVEAGY